jgi:hypothetical protein
MMTVCRVVVYQPLQCQGRSSLPQWRGQGQASTKYRDGMSHQEQSGESQEEQERACQSYLSVAYVILWQMTIVTLGTTI